MPRLILAWFIFTTVLTLFIYGVDKVMKKEIGRWSARIAASGIIAAIIFAFVILIERL